MENLVMSMFDLEDTSPSTERLIALIKAGYKIDEATSIAVGDTIWLEHPACERCPEKTLLLTADGWVFGQDPFDDQKTQLRINPNDPAAFQRFLRSVPIATWWEKNNGPFYVIAAWAIVAAIFFTGAFLFAFVWKILTDHN
jgi:hypothetical protein